MKIALVGPGIMPIPPDGWGAVEMLIWDYHQILKSWGHQVDIINIPDRNEIVDRVNKNHYDVVHVHYDHFYDIMPILKANVKIISSHYPYIHIPAQWASDDYSPKFSGICLNTDWWIFASSVEDVALFQRSALYGSQVFHARLGVNHHSYKFNTLPQNNKTLCLGKITDRKYQWFLQNIGGIDFVGKYGPGRFNPHTPQYLGEMSRKQLNETITTYSNFILLSVAENATPLVVKESLICGLGVVVSECCALELDDKPFITVIPSDQMNNPKYIEQAIALNKLISVSKRDEIREYAIQKFSMDTTLTEYVNQIENINATKM